MDKLKVFRLNEGDRDIMNQLIATRNLEETGDKGRMSDNLGPLITDSLYVFAGEYDGEYAGWLSACVIPKANDKLGTLYIDELWVKEELRRHGIAKAMMDAAIAVAKERNLWKIRLVAADNVAAKKFYENAGFSLYPTLYGEMDI